MIIILTGNQTLHQTRGDSVRRIFAAPHAGAPHADAPQTRAPRTSAPQTSAPQTNAPQPSAPLHADEFFAHQPSPRAALPAPTPLLENLTRCVIEILAGARDLEQISRWVTDDVYRHLLKRVVLSARARQAKGKAPARPTFSIGSVSIFEPRDGVVESVVIVRGRARVRAVAIRLEGLDSRWRATAINVL